MAGGSFSRGDGLVKPSSSPSPLSNLIPALWESLCNIFGLLEVSILGRSPKDYGTFFCPCIKPVLPVTFQMGTSLGPQCQNTFLVTWSGTSCPWGSFSLEKESERRNSAAVHNSLIDNDKNDGNKPCSGAQGSKRGKWTVCILGRTAGKTIS